MQQQSSASWVVRHYGDGDVSYQSFGGPMVDPSDADVKTEEVAQEVAAVADGVGQKMGDMHVEAVPLDQAIREYRQRSGRHASAG